MDNFLRVRVLDGQGHRVDQLGRLGRGQRPAGEVLVQAAALDQFHREIRATLVFADFVHLDDVGVPHARRRLGLDAEAGAFLRAGQGAVANQFEGDQPLRFRLAGLVDDPHAAAAQLLQDLVAGDTRPLRRCSRGGCWPVPGGGRFGHHVCSFPRPYWETAAVFAATS